MYDTNRAFTSTELGLAAIDDFALGFEDFSPEFIKAFCELLAIQQERKSEPIVIVPRGPYTVH